MKKQVRTLLIVSVTVLVLVALLLGLLFLLPEKNGEDTSSDTTSSDTTVSLINKSTDKDGKSVSQPVTKAVITLADETYTITSNSEKELVVKGYEDLPINSTEISSLTSALASLSASRKVADDSAKAADYGLNKPTATAEVTYHDGTVIKIDIGSEAVGGAGDYVRLNGEGPIYLVDTTFGDQVTKKSVLYIGTALITAPQVKSGNDSDTATLKDMTLSGTLRASKLISLRVADAVKDGSSMSNFTYVITAPYYRGSNDTVGTMASSMTSLTAAQAVKAHPTAADLKTYGLDKPYSICEMTLAVLDNSSSEESSTSSTSTTTKSAVYYNSTKHTVKLGGKDADGKYYCMVDDYKAVYVVEATAVPWAESTYNDLATNMLFLKDITTVDSISLEYGSKKTTFKLAHFPDKEESDDMLTVTVDGKKLSTPNFRSLYQVFMMVYRHGVAESKPTGTPDLTFTMKPISSSDKTVSVKFYKISASLYTCVHSDGEYYTVKASTIQKLLTEWDNYLNGKDVSTN